MSFEHILIIVLCAAISFVISLFLSTKVESGLGDELREINNDHLRRHRESMAWRSNDFEKQIRESKENMSNLEKELSRLIKRTELLEMTPGKKAELAAVKAVNEVIKPKW